jgi:hypothetical protein
MDENISSLLRHHGHSIRALLDPTAQSVLHIGSICSAAHPDKLHDQLYDLLTRQQQK